MMHQICHHNNSPAAVVVLDVDDTLYAERDFVVSALGGAGDYAKRRWGVSGVGERAIKLFLDGRRRDIFQAAFTDLGLAALKQSEVDELVLVYRSHRPSTLPWFEDAAEFVRKYHADGGRLAAITDGYLPTQRNKVDALGLATWAAPIVLSEELGRDAWKPSQKPYAAVEGAFPLGSRFIYVADNPKKDFVAARALGWRTVRIRRVGGEYADIEAPTPDHAPDCELGGFDSLGHVLREWGFGGSRNAREWH